MGKELRHASRALSFSSQSRDAEQGTGPESANACSNRMENFNRAAHRRSRGGRLIFLFRKNSTDDGRGNHGHALVSALQFKKSGFPQQLPLFPGQYRGFRLFSSGFRLIPSGPPCRRALPAYFEPAERRPPQPPRKCLKYRRAAATGGFSPLFPASPLRAQSMACAILHTENSSMEEAESLFSRVSISCSDSAHIREQHCSRNRTLTGAGRKRFKRDSIS